MSVRTAVITGVARPHGIGRHCARRFLEAGYRVVGLDVIDPHTPLWGHESNTHFIKSDVASMNCVRQLPGQLQLMGISQVHVLINNAGISDPYMPLAAAANAGTGPALDVCHAAWQQYLDVNLTGPFIMTQALLPLMPAGQSAIIHISSTRAKQSEPNTEGYAASKAGLIGLTHAQAVSLARHARVNAVLPGWIDTSGDPQGITEAQHDWHLTGSVGVPNDVAELCLFLADEERARFITGQEFVIDGGVTRKMVYPE